MNSDHTIDYVVVDLDGGDMLAACLRSIDEQTLVARRIVVVDNGSMTPVSVRLPQMATPVDVISLERNHGFAGGANAGLIATTSKVVALINNDVVLDRAWAAKCLAALHSSAGIAAVQSIIIASDGSIDGAGIALIDGRITQLGHGTSASSSATLPEPWGVSATAALFCREALIDVAFDARVFDERFFAYYEDVDLAARLRAKGWRFALVRELLATHRGSATASRLQWRSDHLRIRNRYLVARKNRGAGEVRALLFEDARRIAGRLVRLDLRRTLRYAQAVATGLLYDLK